MAFNYWFYPPTTPHASFEKPYEDELVWAYLLGRDLDLGADDQKETRNGKGKGKKRKHGADERDGGERTKKKR